MNHCRTNAGDIFIAAVSDPENVVNAASGGQGLFLKKLPLDPAKTFHKGCTYPYKDLTTPDGLSRTLEFETLHDEGSIKLSRMEYQ